MEGKVTQNIPEASRFLRIFKLRTFAGSANLGNITSFFHLPSVHDETFHNFLPQEGR